jgi:hypothetical protein
VLKHAGIFLVLSSATMTTSSAGSAADLQLRIEPTAARHELSLKRVKELFEEYLKWKSQQSR